MPWTQRRGTAAQTWRFDRDALAIYESGPDGLALFEVLSATSYEQATIAAAAPALLNVLEHISARPDLLEDEVYREQVRAVIQSANGATS